MKCIENFMRQVLLACNQMMEKFFADMTAGDKQKMMLEMMPRMVEGVDMAAMMPQMMPHCLGAMLPAMPKEERVEFVLRMVEVLKEQGSAGMSDEEKQAFVTGLVERATT